MRFDININLNEDIKKNMNHLRIINSSSKNELDLYSINKNRDIFIGKLNESSFNEKEVFEYFKNIYKSECLVKSISGDSLTLEVEDETSKVKLDICYNSAYGEFLNKYLDNSKEKENIKLKLNEEKFYALYNGEVIGIDNTSNIYRNFNLAENLNFEISEEAIIIDFPKKYMEGTNNITQSSLFKYAVAMEYSLEKVKYLIDNNIPLNLIYNLLKKIGTTNRVETIKPDTLFIDDSFKLKASLIKVLNDGHLRFFGTKSTGKNTLADTLFWILERKVYKFSSNPHADIGDFVGETELVSVEDKNGNSQVITAFQERVLTKAMREGAVLLIDEINVNNLGVLAILHGPCDDSKTLSTKNGDVKASNGFLVVATMNEDYIGTSKLNPALVDRMLGIKFEAPKTIKHILKAKKPGIKESLLNYLDNIFQIILKLVKDEMIDDSAISIRGMIDIIDLVDYGFTFEEAVEVGLINRIQDNDYRNTLIDSLKMH